MATVPSNKLREAGSPQPARRRLGRRLSATHVLIASVVILAFVLNLLVLQDRSAMTLVAIADEPLTAGSVFDPSTLRLVPVDSDFKGLSDMITEADLDRFEGWVLARSVATGGLVDRSVLVEPGSSSGLRTMSLPVPVEHSAGGSLEPGDRVDVISVIEGTARFVAVDLEVVSVANQSTGAIGTISEHHVVVAVEADQALDLARALEVGSVEIIRATGAEPIDEAGGSGT